MALDFTDFGLSPEEQVANRKAALDSFSNLSGPALREQQARERGQLLTNAYVGAAQATQEGKPQDVTGVQAKAQAQAAELLPEQGKKADAMNLQGANYREDIISSKQNAAMTRYETQTAEEKTALAREVANQSFEYGISAEQLALAQDTYLADEGLKRLYQDYEAGRVNKAEVADLTNKLALQAKNLEYKYQQEAATLQGQLKEAIMNRNIEAAKSLAAKMMARQREIMEAAAKSNAMGSILSGAFKIAAVGAATYFGGPAGGVAAAAAVNSK